MAATILPVIERKGGKVYQCSRCRDHYEGNQAVGVRLEDGKEAFAKTIISDAESEIPTVSSTGATRKKHGFAKKLDNVPPSVAHISLYIGLNTTSENPWLSKNNRWVYQGEYKHCSTNCPPNLTTFHGQHFGSIEN